MILATCEWFASVGADEDLAYGRVDPPPWRIERTAERHRAYTAKTAELAVAAAAERARQKAERSVRSRAVQRAGASAQARAKAARYVKACVSHWWIGTMDIVGDCAVVADYDLYDPPVLGEGEVDVDDEPGIARDIALLAIYWQHQQHWLATGCSVPRTCEYCDEWTDK